VQEQTEDITLANRNFPQSKVWGNHLMPVHIDCSASIGASGAPTLQSDNDLGVASLTRLSAGRYRLKLQDNFAKLINLDVKLVSPVSGSDVAAGSLTPGVVYQITAMGTSTQANWVTAGVPSGITAAVGVVFLCAATSSGTGTAKAIGVSGIHQVEMLGQSNNMLNNQPYVSNQGGYVDFQCLGPTAADDSTLIPTDPASGSIMYINVMVNNSKIQ
jgi:hypothetical protein